MGKIQIANKKGEEVKPELSLISWVIIVFVIIMVIIFIVQAEGGQIGKLKIFLSRLFNAQEPVVQSIEIVRYDIIEGKVNYYDGLEWQSFKEPIIKLGDKEIAESDLETDFVLYYTNKQIRGPSKRSVSTEILQELIGETGREETKLVILITGIPMGSVTALLRDETSGVLIGEFSLNLENKLDFRKSTEDGLLSDPEHQDPLTNVFKEVGLELIAWRDSIDKVPIEIHFRNQDPKKYCIEKTALRYLVIRDLSNPSEIC